MAYEPTEHESGYTFTFSRLQFAYLVLSGAFVCMTFFIFGYKLGQNLTVAAKAPVSVEAQEADLTSSSVYIIPEPEGEGDAAPEPDPTGTPEPPSPTPYPTDAPATEDPGEPATPRPAVKPTTPPTPRPKPTTVPGKAGGTKYSIQVGSFRDKAGADEMLRRLEAAGFDAFVQQLAVNDSTTLYRVRVGRYPNASAADAGLKKLTQKGFTKAYKSEVGPGGN